MGFLQCPELGADRLNGIITASGLLFGHKCFQLLVELHDLNLRRVDLPVAVGSIHGPEVIVIGKVRTVTHGRVPDLGDPVLLGLLRADDHLLPITFFSILVVVIRFWLFYGGPQFKENPIVLVAGKHEVQEGKTIHRLGKHVEENMEQVRADRINNSCLEQNPEGGISNPDGEVGGASHLQVESNALDSLGHHLFQAHPDEHQDVVPCVQEE